MKAKTVADPPRETQRIDRLLWMLRLTRTRGAAQVLVGEGHIRLNGRRVMRAAQAIAAGDVLTLPLGPTVHVLEILGIPARRGPAAEARACYREIASASQQHGAA